MNLGENIKNLRKRKGLSQEQFAEILGVSGQTVSKWELGSSTPDLEKLLLISQNFKISIDDLLENHMYKGTNNSKFDTIFNNISTENIKKLLKKKGYLVGYVIAGWGVITLISLCIVGYGWCDMLLDPFTEYDNGFEKISELAVLPGFMKAPFIMLAFRFLISLAVIVAGLIIVIKGKRNQSGGK